MTTQHTFASDLPAIPTTPPDDRGVRRMLHLDAALTGVNGLAYVVLPGLLGSAFGIGSGLLVGLGIFLLVVAAEVVYLATREKVSHLGLLVLAEVNLLWVVASIVLLFIAELTFLGIVWVIAQAVIVGGFATAQLRARQHLSQDQGV